ncbi:MAG: lysophospholipid acyltransferase family protein, partial [Pseudomonadota bacterium]|nr:lysophospholipid acyltransferase family protein [Pseudomonadota bacterium]
DTQAAIASLEQARARLSNGASVLFFPEGTRSRDGQLKPFKKGAFKMAQDLQLPVLPITLTGTFEILPPGTARLRPGQHAEITLHPAIPTLGTSDAELVQLMHQSQAAIALPLSPAGSQVTA